LAAALVEHEQRWLPFLAPTLPLPIPVPVRAGRPGAGYPWAWSVCPWLPGTVAASASLADPDQAAVDLARFVAALHRPAPRDAPANPYRGIPLEHRTERLLETVDALRDAIDGASILSFWAATKSIPAWSGPALWLHGDLHPANILVDNGRISAVIDFGDLTAGDPATDLAVAWMLFDPVVRSTFRDAVGGVDDATWARARAWAVALGVAYIANSANNATFTNLGRRVVDAALSDST
jgi:aminoglycoside phosphotransferase (APT) family kinase protein